VGNSQEAEGLPERNSVIDGWSKAHAYYIALLLFLLLAFLTYVKNAVSVQITRETEGFHAFDGTGINIEY
jgi:hypothetical protein